MSLSTDCRVASLVAFSQARAMGTATNAGGGAVAGGADCGRDPDGKFGGGNKCAGSGGGTSRPKSLEQQRLEAAGTFAATQEKTQADKVGEMKDYLRRLGHGWADFVRKAQAHDPARIKNANHAKNNAAKIFATEGAAGLDRYLEQIGMRSIRARYASLLAFAEPRDCGRDPDGKFSSGNTCASGVVAEAAQGAATGAIKGALAGLFAGGPATVKPGAVLGAATGAVKGIYDNQMRPTRVKKTIERLGMDVKQVGELVEKLGGTPESTADAKGGTLRLTIRDKGGKKTFHVEVSKDTVTVYPRRATGELTSKEISRVKEIADKSTPKLISVVVKKSSSAYVSKLVRNGFTVAAGHAGDVLVATYLAAPVHSVAHEAVQSIKSAFSRR